MTTRPRSDRAERHWAIDNNRAACGPPNGQRDWSAVFSTRETARQPPTIAPELAVAMHMKQRILASRLDLAIRFTYPTDF